MTRLQPKPDPDRQLARLPDGPLCAHLAQQAFDAALDLLAQVGALRPFGIVMDATGAIHLRVPPASTQPPTGLLEAVDGGARLTQRGRLLANEVFSRLLPESEGPEASSHIGA